MMNLVQTVRTRRNVLVLLLISSALLLGNLGKFEDAIHYGVLDFAPYIFQWIFPWSLLLLALPPLLFLRRRFRTLPFAFPVCGALSITLVSVIPATRFKHYMIPILSPAALLIAGLWSEAQGHPLRRMGAGATAALFGVLALVLAALIPIAGATAPRVFLGAAFFAMSAAFCFMVPARLPVRASRSHSLRPW